LRGDVETTGALKGDITTNAAYVAVVPPTATGSVLIYDNTGTAYRVAVVV